ncbi:MAG: gamma-glutamylcyclotransferase family protein [Oscillospiraceae bacterium]
MNENLYFAYGSNMNLEQMAHRCPNAKVVGAVSVRGYRLAFCGKKENGVATIVPQEGRHVDGVLWKITTDCEKSLDMYEGYPRLYGKKSITVSGANMPPITAMVYTMNAPYRDTPALPSKQYLNGILCGCYENKISSIPIMQSVQETRNALPQQQNLFKQMRPFSRER